MSFGPCRQPLLTHFCNSRKQSPLPTHFCNASKVIPLRHTQHTQTHTPSISWASSCPHRLRSETPFARSGNAWRFGHTSTMKLGFVTPSIMSLFVPRASPSASLAPFAGGGQEEEAFISWRPSIGSCLSASQSLFAGGVVVKRGHDAPNSLS